MGDGGGRRTSKFSFGLTTSPQIVSLTNAGEYYVQDVDVTIATPFTKDFEYDPGTRVFTYVGPNLNQGIFVASVVIEVNKVCDITIANRVDFGQGPQIVAEEKFMVEIPNQTLYLSQNGPLLLPYNTTIQGVWKSNVANTQLIVSTFNNTGWFER